MGTDSVLADCRNDYHSDINYWRFMTIRNWGELAYGDWTLTITDCTTGDIGNLNFWELSIHGHTAPIVEDTGSISVPSVPW